MYAFVGFLRLGYDFAVHYPTMTVVESGNAVADSPQNDESVTPLGLKLMFPDGSQGVAVPTHVFIDVKTPQKRIAHNDTGWIARMKAVLCKYASMKMKDAVKI